MVCLDAPSRIHVRRGGVLRLQEAEGTVVTCHAGAVWVTLEDDPRDILIEAGESFVIDRRGLSLVCAIAGPAEVAIAPPATIAADDAAPLETVPAPVSPARAA